MEYFSHRYLKQRECADVAQNEKAAKIHLNMALRYAGLPCSIHQNDHRPTILILAVAMASIVAV